ncbi:phosphatase PAP2 family protein [Streptomyces zingiberis]|uniref:Phosphatase PAP2 family protein n=1 Tax=Streptomyces zingiberis TaxID=2053010 RepID=A0ABX1BSN9_9ACTN|nr:phosphatase PAP2 family protein [Streptomyces zingiberis]NJQ00098.1 phosphatase PAP2 family protein [Streptomyces zingiberis]
MAGLEAGSPVAETTGDAGPDVELLYDINGLTAATPHWFDQAMEWFGEYGTVFGVLLLLLGCWWVVRKRPDAPAAVAGLVWAPLATGLALLANIPIRNFVERPRPFLDHQGLEVLIQGKTDYSFVSDHSTLAMALAVGIFVVHRKFGLAAIVLAVVAGVSRIYMGVHYPTDVIGGFALGTAVTLLLAPLALAMLTPLMRTVAGSRAGWLVQARGTRPEGGEPGSPSAEDRERNLAA